VKIVPKGRRYLDVEDIKKNKTPKLISVPLDSDGDFCATFRKM
jgi:hypothetical protein